MVSSRPSRPATFLRRSTWWSIPSATWCVGPAAHQSSKNLAGLSREPDARVRVSDSECRSRDGLTLGCEKLQPTVGGLRKPEDGDRAETDFHLDRESRARLPVVQLQCARDGSPVGDSEVSGAVVSHEDELLVEVEAVELGV